jgi:hypothetical protein
MKADDLRRRDAREFSHPAVTSSQPHGARDVIRGFLSKKWLTLGSIGFLFAIPTLVFGQTSTIDRQVKGKPDTNINAGIFLTIRHDCTTGPLPVIRLLVPPTHGKVTVKQGRLRATNLKQCLGMDLPAFVAVYRSFRNYAGQDNFTLEVISAEGKSQILRMIVTIADSASGRSQGI